MKFLGNLGEMFEQAQRLQGDMARVKEELEQREISASSGGGMVKVSMTGALVVTSVEIEKELLDLNDRKMLEDLVKAAVNEVLKKSKDMLKEEFTKLAGGIPIPGLF